MSQLFGNKPNQVPLNQHLGGMAYLDPGVALPLAVMPLVQGAAIVESATNANGSYVRYADGTQICYKVLTIPTATTFAWTYPAAFLTGTVGLPSAMPYGVTAGTTVTDGGTNTSIQVALTSVSTGAYVSGGMAIIAIGKWR